MRWTSAGIEYEADPRQAGKLLRDLKLDEGVKSVGTPGVRATRDQLDADAELPPDKTSPYRAVVARANYLAADRPDIQFAVRTLATAMAKPTMADWQKLKRLGMYLKGKPRLIIKYIWQNSENRVTANSDSDWAGDKKTRKSTSGGILRIGNHFIKSWSKN